MVAELDNLVEYFKTDAESNKGELDGEYARAQQSFYNDAKLRLEKGLALLNAWSRSCRGPETGFCYGESNCAVNSTKPIGCGSVGQCRQLGHSTLKRCAGAVLCSATWPSVVALSL